MNAYQGIITKKEFVSELRKHQKADAFLRGTYGKNIDNNFKGCAVGCSLESISRLKKIKLEFSDHTRYPELLGIPEWLAHVEDMIFEGVSVERSKKWPVEFAEAIHEGTDLDKIKAPFMICILESTLDIKEVKENPAVLKSIKDVIALWKKYPKVPRAAWSAAEIAAWNPAESVTGVTESAAMSAVWSAGWNAGWNPAESVTGVTESAAWSAAESAAYEYFADRLLELLRDCK